MFAWIAVHERYLSFSAGVAPVAKIEGLARSGVFRPVSMVHRIATRRMPRGAARRSLPPPAGRLLNPGSKTCARAC